MALYATLMGTSFLHSLEAELLDMYEGFIDASLIEGIGQDIRIEGDSLTIIKSFEQSNGLSSTFARIWKSIARVLATHFFQSL